MTDPQQPNPKTEVLSVQPVVSDPLDSLTRNKDSVLQVIGAIGNEVSHARTARIKVSQQISWMVFLFLALIIVGTGALVYVGRVSDGSFTFLLGVIVGYLMQFADKLVRPQDE
jgi:hypothetical protein